MRETHRVSGGEHRQFHHPAQLCREAEGLAIEASQYLLVRAAHDRSARMRKLVALGGEQRSDQTRVGRVHDRHVPVQPNIDFVIVGHDVTLSERFVRDEGGLDHLW